MTRPMLRNATIPPERAWSTWSGRAAEMVFLPLGVRLTPVAYAGSRDAATLFPPGDGLRLGHHDLAAQAIDLDLTHAGTTLAWSYAKPDPFRVVGRWRATALGEWGLRFWVNLCLSAENGEEVVYDPDTAAAVVKVGGRFVALVGGEPAVQVTGHDTVEAVVADYEAHGYFHLASRASRAPVLALRYNLEMMREMGFALAVADRRDLAIARARGAMEAPPPAPAPPIHTGRHAGALDAIRDVMAWNTVWDAVNARPYTSISRNWNQRKFGGFGVWLDDQLYAALMTGMLDPDVGRENLRAALGSATPQGNFACLVTANDAWVDRTQLPIASFVVWSMFLRSRDRSLLTLMAEALRRNHAWWWANRDPEGRGLVSYGTSDVGEGLYKGTSFGARNESSMDNAPIHDEARYDPATRTLDSLDVGLNSLLALDAEMLALIAAELGDDAGRRDPRRAGRGDPRPHPHGAVGSRAPHLREPAPVGRLRAQPRADELLPARRRRPHGGADREPARAPRRSRDLRRRARPARRHPRRPGLPRQLLLARAHLAPPELLGLAGAAPRRPPRRGPRPRGAELRPVLGSLGASPLPRELQRRHGRTPGSARHGRLLRLGALMPAMAVGDVTDVSPWSGWEVTNGGQDVVLGPIESPAGPVTVSVSGGVLAIRKGDRLLLETDLPGTLTDLRIEAGRVSFVLASTAKAESFVHLPAVAGDVLLARAGGRDLTVAVENDGIRLTGFAARVGAVVVDVVSSIVRRVGATTTA